MTPVLQKLKLKLTSVKVRVGLILIKVAAIEIGVNGAEKRSFRAATRGQ